MDWDEAPNLSAHRATASVWERRGWQGRTVEERVGPWLVSLAGAGLFSYGASRRSWRGVWWMIGGLGLIGAAAVGLANPHEAATRWSRLRSVRQPPIDTVTRESMDSFPASDAPSSNATTVSPSPRHKEEG